MRLDDEGGNDLVRDMVKAFAEQPMSAAEWQHASPSRARPGEFIGELPRDQQALSVEGLRSVQVSLELFHEPQLRQRTGHLFRVARFSEERQRLRVQLSGSVFRTGPA